MRNLGRFEEALAAFEAAEALGSREAVAGKGCLLLTLGDFERGFEGYEARWLDGKSLAAALGARFPTWRAPGRPGERVLVLNDHGLGDTIQFVRYLPLMAAAGVETTFVCPARLHRLLSSRIVTRFVDAPPDESFDAQIAISSLPRAFRTRLDTVPANSPYLSPNRLWSKNGRIESDRPASRSASPGRAIRIRRRTAPAPSRSSPSRRSRRIAGVRLISLQKGLRRGAAR